MELNIKGLTKILKISVPWIMFPVRWDRGSMDCWE